ncbi:MAG: glycoside hydrolase [Gemmatimonadetes bacterium]|nr:glycoside hydrolase [Gemmatimonadota bacterium]
MSLRRIVSSAVACTAIALLALLVVVPPLCAQGALDTRAIKELKWRSIGPFRGGRTKSATGVPSQPNVFYMGVINGGVWKSTDYGRTWNPIFDGQPTQSVGAVEVSLSNPNVLYVGSGEGLQRPDLSTGDGIYKSTDAGKSWKHLGLRDAQQIPRIVIDPTNPERIFVAALGHPYGPNAERGVFRSVDGGTSFQRVLFKDENTGAAELVMAPDDPNTLLAALWEARQGPWENGAFRGPGTGLYKSTDGGTTWKPITAGIPSTAEGIDRIGLSFSQANPKRVYATINAQRQCGIYRSEDAGDTWTRVNNDNRICGRGDDFAAPTADPKNADVVYSANVVAWKSVDGGKTWNAHRGAPGGDDYQRYWINPNNTDIQLLVSDQGGVVTVNGGKSWSSWYNQNTAQFYHVTADNAYPYRLCGGQQESGSACVASRGNDGSIGYREWRPVGVEEYGYVAPDPLNPDIVYGGKVTRFDRRTGQTQQVGPRVGRGGGAGVSDYRTVRTAPVLFSPTNPKKLYFASNTLWETVDGGQHWKQSSPDLARESWEAPANVGKYAGTPAAAASKRGVIYTIAPSPKDSNTIWAGTDDGQIQVTRNNGKAWTNVTPPSLPAWAKVSLMDASHFDAGTAYAAINTLRLDDLRPHILRTRDGGKTWADVVSGIDSGATVNVVREDPARRGLLYAGTENGVWVSIDDGDHWQSLRLNLPSTSVRDLIIKDNDVAVGTHGRGFWILDDVSALRQWNNNSAGVTLYKPAIATRVRYSMYSDTPVPPDEPMAENPPDGAAIDYFLAADANGVLTIDIVDAKGVLVRHFSSEDKYDAPKDEGNWPWYWFRPMHAPAKTAGLHRYVWDLHFTPPPAQSFSLPISATPFNTKKEPEGPWVHPGTYTVKLSVGGATFTQPITVRMDPRVKTAESALAQQYALSIGLYDAARESAVAAQQVRALRAQIADRKTKAPALAKELDALDASLQTLDAPAAGGRGGGGGRGGAAPAAPGAFASIESQALPIMNVLQDADAAPTSQVVAAADERLRAFAVARRTWHHLTSTDVPALNIKLRAAGAEPLAITTPRGPGATPSPDDEDVPLGGNR